MHSAVVYNRTWSRDKIAQLNQELNQVLTLRDYVSAARRVSPELDAEYSIVIQRIDALEDSMRIMYSVLQEYMNGMEKAEDELIAAMNDQNGRKSFFD